MIQENISLKPYNSFGIDVKAKHFAKIDQVAELQELLTSPHLDHLPLTILGGGSNFLFTQDIAGLVVKVNLRGIELVKEEEEWAWLKVGGGENWHQFVLHCVTQGYGGVENLSLIPGTVGAAPIQNIGAYGVELQSVFHQLTAIELQTGKAVVFNNQDCQFGYRNSIFKGEDKGKYLITNVTLKLSKNPQFNTSYGAIKDTLKEMGIGQLSLKAISDAVIHIRKSKLPDPDEIGNAGSFFKNPTIADEQYQELKMSFPELPGYTHDRHQVKVPAAWMIEYCGWKGTRRGPIGVHKDQALVLVNYGGGEGREIKQLAIDIQVSVKKTFGIELQPEVNMI